MGRSGVGGGSRGGGGRSSGGGRSGGSRSSGRSAMGSSSSRSFSSGRSASGGFNSAGRSGAGGYGSRPGSFGPGAGNPGPTPNRHQPGGPAGGPQRRPIGFWPFFRGTNIFINTGSGSAGQTVYSENTEKRKSGCLSTVLIIVIWLVLIYAMFSLIGGGGPRVSYEQNSVNFTKSTVNRKKLNLNLSDEAGYFTDECSWIRNRTTLEKGLKDFYDSTGILPYVYIIDNVAGDYDPSTEKLEQFAEDQYEELFDDEGHALLVFWDYAGAYEYTLWLGADAAELMDTEACDILFDYLDYYYYYADTDEAFFADAFSDAGERMMSVTRSPIYYVVIVVAAGAVIFVVCRVIKSRREKEAARKKRAEEILNSPLEKFGDNGDIIDELEKKYEKEI